MKPFLSTLIIPIAFLSLSVVFLASVSAARPAQAAPPIPDAERVQQAVAATVSRYAPPGTQLLGSAVNGNTVLLNFSREILSRGDAARRERALEAIFTAVEQLQIPYLRDMGYDLQVEGQPLSEWLSVPKAQAIVERGQPWLATAGNVDASSAPVSSTIPFQVAISPGHGWTHYDDGVWKLQRSYWWGIVEDFVNWDMTFALDQALTAAGFDVRPTRNMDKNAGIGQSGHNRWEEAARYHIQELGAPDWVWDRQIAGPNLEENQDIDSRPLYANWLNSALLVSLHNNGSPQGFTYSGTEVWYDDCNDYVTQSAALASAVRARVISRLRTYDPNWVDRGLKHACWAHGENHFATRPAIIIEFAFMNTENPDNTYLHDARFKQLAGQATADGIMDYLGVLSDPDDNRHLASGTILTGTIAPAIDEDVYQFYAQAGWDANISVSSSDGNLAPTIGLYRPDGTLVRQDPNAASAPSATLNRAALSDTGWYRISIDSVRQGTTGPYTVSLNLVSPVPDADDGRYLSDGIRLTGVITPADDVDVYFFTAEAHQAVTMTMTHLTQGLDPYLHLFGPDGHEVTFDDDSAGNSDARITVADLPLTGRYRILAHSYHNASSGSYALDLTLHNPSSRSGEPATLHQYFPLFR